LSLKVLIVDPNQDWLDSAEEFLTGIHYDVRTVNNGRDAQIAYHNDDYYGVIINVETQDHAGFQVLKHIHNKVISARKEQIIFMILDNEGWYEDKGISKVEFEKMDVTETLVKPFEVEELGRRLEKYQSLTDVWTILPTRKETSAEEEMDQGDDNFTKIKINDFYSSQSVLFDIFVRLKKDRYIKILHAGDKFEKERIDKYKAKKVEFLFFRNTDRKKYVQFCNNLSQKIMNNKKVAGVTKVNLLKCVSDKFIEDVFSEGIQKQVISEGKKISSNIYELVEKQDDLYKILREFHDFDPSAFSHTYLVTLFSSSIIKQFEWESKSTIETTALACMFHDIGKMKLDRAFLEKNIEDLSEEELVEYKKHPELGGELVEGNKLINSVVKQIIYQHHESSDGSGFPKGLKGQQILTLANIVKIADDFVHIVMRDKLKPVEALKKLMSTPGQIAKYNTIVIENFMKIFIDPKRILKFDNARTQGKLGEGLSFKSNKKVS